MKDSDSLKHLADSIANEDCIGWQREKEKHPALSAELGQLEKIEKLMIAFKSQEEAGFQEIGDSQEPVLFRWGHLKVVEKIGEGAFGEVFRAYDPILDRDIALKLQSSKSKWRVPTSRYVQEARHMARVRHPNVLAVHGADTHDGRSGLWCDLLVGETLEEKLKQEGELSSDSGLAIAKALCNALICVHGAGLVHGDIKPSNVMEESRGRIVLMDFGAGILSKGPGADQAKSVTGTPLFLAPETLTGTRPSTASDVFALGVLLFRIVTGLYPYRGQTIPELMWSHQKGQLDHLDMLREMATEPFADLIQSMLHPNPKKRPVPREVLHRLVWIEQIPVRRKKRLIFATIMTILMLGTALSTIGFVRATFAERRAVIAKTKSMAVHEFLGNMLISSRKSKRGPDVKLKDLLDDAALELGKNQDIFPETRAAILMDLGMTYRSLAQHEQSIKLLRESLAIRLETLGPHHAIVVETMVELGAALVGQGLLVEANEVLERAYAIGYEHFGLSNDETIVALVNLATVKSHLGEIEMAESLLISFLDYAKKYGYFVGDESLEIHPHSARVRLGGNYVEKGDYQRAVNLLRSELAWYAQNFGEEHAHTSDVRTSLCTALVRAGKLLEAEVELKKNLELAVRFLGENHDDTLGVMVNLAAILEERGKYEEASRYAERALKVSTELRGPDHPQTLLAMGNLGVLKQSQGEFEQALALQRHAVERKIHVLGANNPETLMSRHNLAELLGKMGQCEQAENMSREIHGLLVQALGEQHLFSLEAKQNLALSLKCQGQTREAQDMLRSVLESKKKAIGGTNPYTLDAMVCLAESLLETGQNEEAVKLLEQVIALRREVLGNDHPKTLAAEITLAKQRSGTSQ